jgi:hypothetical protein
MERVRKRDGHKRFEKLCALAQTESLSDKERRAIELHLQECESCLARFREYSAIGEAGLGLVAGGSALTEAARQWDDQPARRKLGLSIRNKRPDGGSRNGPG